jgi:cytochrome c oxidase cbb3-type subunit 1
MDACAEKVPAADDGGYELLTIHGLSWLAAGNAVGLLLATLLLFPRLGDVLAPLSFGRFVPVHLNLQLYGWCGVALIGLLFRIFMPRAGAGRLPELAVGLWSGGLVFAVVSWLAGHSAGKPFLEFSAAARVTLAAVVAALELVLVVAFTRQLREPTAGAATPGGRWAVAAKALLLAALALVPFVLYWASGTAVYPPINPDSGGATGGSLLGSTLAVVAIILATPLIVGLRPRGGVREVGVPVALLACHLVGFALLDHADHSHHEWLQVVGLSSLIIWVPVFGRYLRRFDWPRTARPWLVAFCAWGTLLVSSGALMFLPGALERWKFTNALVGHAHLAMAGMVTSFNVLVLVVVNPSQTYATLFGDRRSFLLWQGGCLLFVVAMMTLGTLEGLVDGLLFRPVPAVQALYAVRWLAGAAMLWASARWLGAAVRGWRPA